MAATTATYSSLATTSQGWMDRQEEMQSTKAKRKKEEKRQRKAGPDEKSPGEESTQEKQKRKKKWDLLQHDCRRRQVTSEKRRRSKKGKKGCNPTETQAWKKGTFDASMLRSIASLSIWSRFFVSFFFDLRLAERVPVRKKHS